MRFVDACSVVVDKFPLILKIPLAFLIIVVFSLCYGVIPE